MSIFVNYRKRSITLPAGCHDLNDLFKADQRKNFKSGDTELVITRGHQATAGLNQVRLYLGRFLETFSELSTLMISSEAEDLSLLFYRNGPDQLFALILLARDSRLENAVRFFFDALGLAPLRTYPVPRQTGEGLGWGLVYPLPSLVAEVAQVIMDLLRAVCVGGEEADFHYRLYQAGGRA